MPAKKTKAEKREARQKPKMPVSGKKVFGLQTIIAKKSLKKH
jgi:hypothetical protein